MPLFWTLAAVALSAVTAFLVARTASATREEAYPEVPVSESATFHDWLHSQLEITPEQEEQLAPIEALYASQRNVLRQRIREAGETLASALGNEPPGGPGIETALIAIHEAQGELQRVTIEHFLKMKEHLSPEQSRLLLQWTRESITHDDSR